MKRMVFSLLWLSVILISFSFAATSPQNEALFPIQSISLSYNLNKSTLHIEAVHPSNNWERDFIRMMTISLNSQPFSTVNYYHQKKASGFSEDVELNAQVGDVISVALYCTQGSSMTQELTVTQSAASSDQGGNTGADNSTTDNTAN